MKRVDWLDTLRVFASFLVVLSHYAYVVADVPSSQHFIRTYILNIGSISNMLFFAVSGYLAANSLEHSKSLLEYYRRKVIRIVTPYTVSCIVLGVLLIFLGMFEPKIATQSPFNSAIHGGNWQELLLRLFPVSADVNLLGFLGFNKFSAFIGEWFIAAIIYLYFIAPLLYKCLKKNSALTIIASVIISVKFIHFSALPMPITFFGGRIQEFLAGMILYHYKDFIVENFSRLNKTFIVLAAGLIIYAAYFNTAAQSIWVKTLLGKPYNIYQYLIADAIVVYLSYAVAVYLNKHFEKWMTPFNNFSQISYVAMLIQHVVIYRFAWSYKFSDLGKFGVFFFFVAILMTTIVLSEHLKNIYKPIEERLIKRRFFVE